MSRQKLIRQLKEKNQKLNQSELEKVVDIFSDCISEALKAGNNVEIRWFGILYCNKLKENFYARNPASNELIYKPERIKVRFRSSKSLKKIINK